MSQTSPAPAGGAAPALAPDGYAARILRRRRIWWEKPWSLSPGSGLRWLHRARERYTYRRRDDPDAAWRCCALWPRALHVKWNSREFARRHDCRVPDLYWTGLLPWRVPFASLPPRYVVRPFWGGGSSNVLVVVDGRELFGGGPASPADVRRRLVRDLAWFRLDRLLIEEYVAPEEGGAGLPIEYKCHVFGARVAAVQVIERPGAGAKGRQRFYTPAWEPFSDPMTTIMALAEPRPAPAFLAEMLACAERLGRALATYMRIDFFGGARGCVFNEMTSTTAHASPRYITPHCDELFGRFWREEVPDAV